MLLEKDQKRYLSMLRIGQCICRSDRLTQPVLLSIPNFPVNKGLVTDEDLMSHMRGYLTNLRPNTAPITNPSSICSIQAPETLSPLGRIMLENIAQKPILGVVKRFKELGLKVTHGYKILDELTQGRMIIPRTVDGQKLYEITSAGKKCLGKKYTLKGHGGIEHRYYVEKIKEHYLKIEGFTFIEKDDIDLVVEGYNITIAVQVETGKSNIQANLMKLGRYKSDLKYVLATNKEAEVRIKEIYEDLIVPDKENIQIQFAKDFLNHPPTL
jgi:hypothetical protein